MYISVGRGFTLSTEEGKSNSSLLAWSIRVLTSTSILKRLEIMSIASEAALGSARREVAKGSKPKAGKLRISIKFNICATGPIIILPSSNGEESINDSGSS